MKFFNATPRNGQRDKRVGTAYQLLRDGVKPADVIRTLVSGAVTEGTAIKVVEEAQKLLSTQVERDADVIVALHSNRYDKIYHDIKDLWKDWIQFPQEKDDFFNNAHIVSQYKICLQALKQKEQLYRLNDKDAGHIIADIYFKTHELGEDQEDDGYRPDKHNLAQLSQEELEEAISLLEKCLVVNEDQVKGVDDDEIRVVERPEYSDPKKSTEVVREGYDDMQTIERKKINVNALPEDLEASRLSTEEVKEKLRKSMLAKIKQTYDKADTGREESKRKRNLNVDDGYIEFEEIKSNKKEE